MPASSVDSIASSLKRTFTGMQNGSDNVGLIRGGSSSCIPSSVSSKFEAKLQATAKTSLITGGSVRFDSPTRFVGNVLGSSSGSSDPQGASRFIVLNPGNQELNEIDTNDEAVGESETVPVPKVVFCSLSSIEVGHKKTRPPGAGMFNVGNTCYLNSTLQALFHTPALFNYLTDCSHSLKCNGSTGLNGFIQNCTICAMTHTLRDTLRTNVIKPNRIYEKLKSICKHMIHGRQEDAHEFLRYLIESLQRSFLMSCQATKSIDSASKETTPFNQIFGGYMRQDVTCLKCKHVSTTFQHFMDILLDIRQVSTVEEALDQYFKQERIGGNGDDGANMYKCEKCKVKVPAKKRYLIERAPAVLCIQLKRFSLMGGKISKPVQLSRRLNVAQYVRTNNAEQPKSVEYGLVAMITHVGPSPNCGHYTAIGEAANGQFFQFDDSSVRPIPLGQVLNTASYVVFYEMTKSSWKTTLCPAAPATTPTSQTSKLSQSNKPAPAINFHGRVGGYGGGGDGENKPKLLILGSSAAKLGMGAAKNVVASIARSVTNAAATANGHIRKGLVPYDDDPDSSDGSSETASKCKLKNGNGAEPQQPPPPPPLPPSTFATQFIPRSVTVKALSTNSVDSQEGPQLLKCHAAAAASPVVERKTTSGVWTVTDTDHHSPSVNSDNSTGSTTNGWTVTDSSRSPKSICKSTETAAICETSRSSLSGGGVEREKEKSSSGQPRSSATSSTDGSGRKQSTQIDVGAFAKTFLNDSPRKRANGGSAADYDAELDRGRVKKVRKSDDEKNVPFSSRNGHNPFQNAQNHKYGGTTDGKRAERRSESGGRHHANGKNRWAPDHHRDHNYHADWRRSKKYNHGGGSGDSGRRKSFGDQDVRHYRDRGYQNGAFNRNPHRNGGGDSYRNNGYRDYYGNRHYKR